MAFQETIRQPHPLALGRRPRTRKRLAGAWEDRLAFPDRGPRPPLSPVASLLMGTIADRVLFCDPAKRRA